MNRFKLLATGLVAAAAIAPLAAPAGDTYVYGNVSSWTVRTDPAQAYRCFAEVLYEGGTSIRVGYNIDAASLYLSVTDPSWSGIRPGSERGTTVSFDDGMMLELAARGIAASDSGASAGVLIGIPQAQREAFLADFMARNMLSVAPVGSSPIDLSLAGSARATRMLEECQSSMARHAPGTG